MSTRSGSGGDGGGSCSSFIVVAGDAEPRTVAVMMDDVGNGQDGGCDGNADGGSNGDDGHGGGAASRDFCCSWC